MHHQGLNWQEISALIGGGAGLMRGWNYVSKRIPPLPPDSGWWTTLLYQLVSGTSGHDPANNPVKP